MSVMKDEPELWRRLRVGDRIRLLRLPTDFFDWRSLHRETKEAYRYLLNRRTPLRVFQIDEYGFPWVEFQFRDKSGKMRHDWMAMNHGGIAIVKARTKATRTIGPPKT
jgi:hypothetical protein